MSAKRLHGDKKLYRGKTNGNAVIHAAAAPIAASIASGSNSAQVNMAKSQIESKISIAKPARLTLELEIGGESLEPTL
ncbi:hypothetical protein CEY15_17210 [Dietzia natronolimnaea]|uniref:Uncharacterized protein n=1 Tax=Dietzia natronolimnaea TaxID=161920 RepID=A0A2A2WKL5_9ACTN|nr:hypothetical protein [Dietzia natronolimnaea]PAY21756.1 hypothetical protein CEY15_17210 [Dietzia natronolimnaea]